MSNTKLIGIIVYASALVLIFLFPPMDRVTFSYGKSRTQFYGWDFIGELGPTGFLGVSVEINIILLLIEITVVTLIYGSFLYFTKNNK